MPSTSILWACLSFAQADAGVAPNLAELRAGFVVGNVDDYKAMRIEELDRGRITIEEFAEKNGGDEAALMRESVDRQARSARARIETKMVGPLVKPARWEDHRYQVGLVCSLTRRPGIGQFCGGAMVALDWVLTAAHCLEGLKPRDLVVYHGDANLPGAGSITRRVPSSFTGATTPPPMTSTWL